MFVLFLELLNLLGRLARELPLVLCPGIALLAEATGVNEPIFVNALRRLVGPPHAMVTGVAHSLGVMLQVDVLASGDLLRLIPSAESGSIHGGQIQLMFDLFLPGELGGLRPNLFVVVGEVELKIGHQIEVDIAPI